MSRDRQELMRGIGDAVREWQRATDAVDQAVCDRFGVNRTDGRCLDIVLQYGGVTAGELAERSGMSPAAITTVIDRLEGGGWVSRVRDEQDRRRVVVRATEKSERAAEEIFGEMARDAARAYERYSDHDLDVLYNWLRLAERHQMQFAAWIRGEGDKPRM
jgi:DNA-binding MarR family transcriptional regulator